MQTCFRLSRWCKRESFLWPSLLGCLESTKRRQAPKKPSRRLLEAKLVEPRVEVAAPQKLLVRAAIDDPAEVHHHDPVGQGDRRHVMRDHQRCAAANELFQHSVNEL